MKPRGPMTEPMLEAGLPMLFAGALGLLLGGAFYGGLLWTVRRGVASTRPALWFFGSGLARTGVALLVFWAVGQGRWERLAACLAGFFVARLLVTRWSSGGRDAAGSARVEAT